ncbi:hypothetical protein [Antarctobacter sp.]|uniref:aldose epimerase family protein n=1 Tax=Antarctobacter sp. TaxID=1872577 RepID=UPI003A94AA04
MSRSSSSIGSYHRLERADECSIRNAQIEARFAPWAGGRIVSLRHVDHGDILVPLNDLHFAPDAWPKAGAFPLFPFHNRIRDAYFTMNDRRVRLRPNMANGRDVMHGPAHQRPWDITEIGPTLLGMTLNYHADDDWPFDFTASQRFELCEDGLSISLKLINSGKTAMPGGIGWHPYFKPTSDDSIRVHSARPAKKSRAGNRPGANDPITLDVAHHYSGWTHSTVRIDTETSATISLKGDAELSYCAVLHKADYLCIEPVSHLAGAFDAAPTLWPETGLRLLAPGASMKGTARLRVF